MTFHFKKTEKYIKKVIDASETPITLEMLKTYSIVLINKIKIELKEISSKVDNVDNYCDISKLILLIAFLEYLLEEIQRTKHDYLMK